MTKIIFAFFLIAVLLTGTIVPASFAQTPGLDRIRVVAADGEELDNALANGCKLVREAGPLNGVICNPRVAESLGLRADMKLHAVDVDANTQIGANVVQLSNNGEGTNIAIFDTGYDYNHVDLQSSYRGGYDFVNNDPDPLDDDDHGSHVAGIIVSDGINSRSIGVAPNAGVYSYKVLDATGSGSFTDVLAAFQLIVWGPDGVFGTLDDNSDNIDAISLSLGSSKPSVWKGSCDAVEPDMTSVIQQAKSLGIAVVIAAGNEGRAGVSFPGCISDSITVAAVNDKDKRPNFSGTGTAVDIAAPGVSIYSTLLADNYNTKSGTSMATPVVTGTIALMKSANNALSVSDIESALFNTATDLGDAGKDTLYGHGRVNADLAVAYTPGVFNNPPTITITSPTDGVTLTSGALITFTATATDVEDVTISDISWSSNIDGSFAPNTSDEAILGDGEHTITAQVTDSGGKTSTDSITITVGTPVEPPTSDAETANIDYKLRKGPNGGLIITVTLLDGANPANPVTETTLQVELLHDGNSLGVVDHMTDSEGKAGFRLPNPVKSGIYETIIWQVADVEWTGTTNGAIFEK